MRTAQASKVTGMRRVLVTGATGFVGSHLCRQLVQDGFNVAVLVRPGTDCRRIADILPRLTVISSDLKDLRAEAPAVKAYAPEIVFHLAWYGVANQFRNDPQQVPENVNGSFELLHLASESGCRLWIGLGSQAEYGVYDRIISEEMPAKPVTIYGTTKLAVCRLAQQLCSTRQMEFAWLRLFSCYGPDDNACWLIPSVISTLLRGERPALTWGTQCWDYLYVEDAAQALIQVAKSPVARGILNLASGEASQVRTIVERIQNLIDPSLPLGFGELEYRPDQIMHLQGDIRRLQESTGWSPRYALSAGLEQTINWYRQHC